MSKTGINWADMTWNPVRGCTRVSEGCRNCYAEQAAARIVRIDESKGKPSKYDGLVTHKLRVISDDEQWIEARWTGDVAFDPVVLAKPLKRKKPTTYFVNSMSDLFHDGFTDEQIAAVFGVMAATPQHRYIVLTKRAERMRQWFSMLTSHAHPLSEWTRCHAEALRLDPDGTIHRRSEEAPGRPWPLPNVILGVSVENQATADERIPHLLATPAAVRAISAEPLLGPLDLSAYLGEMPPNAGDFSGIEGARRGIDWIVAGCESGPNARPCEVDWLRSLAVQCVDAQVPFWIKQARPWDEGRYGMVAMGIGLGPGSKRKPDGIIDLPYLDGVQWAQRPEVRR